ncbi:MAG: response regulator, partial [Rhodospirillaceae bacterium]
MNTPVATPALPETSLGGVRRILLVEDDLLHARLAQVFLTEGEGVVAAVDVADTLTSARACIAENRYDAILLDLGLPDGRGLDLLRIVLSEVPEVPVLVLTAESDEAQATEAVRMGAQDFLIKGRLDRRQLRRAVAYAMARKQVLRTGLAEGLLQSVLNGTHNAVLALTPFGLDGQPRWRVTLANPPCEALFGRPLRELEGAWLDEIALTRPLPGVPELLEEALRTGAVRQHQICLEGGDGAARWLLLDAVACAGGVSVTLTDITSIKAREDELLVAQSRAQKALDDRVSLLHALGQKVPATLERIMQRLDGSAAAIADRRDAAGAETGLTAARAEAAALLSEVEALVNQRQSAGFAYLGANYLSVLEISPDLAAVVRADDGALLFLNRVG